jgi:accessory gene regulator protein AgrB
MGSKQQQQQQQQQQQHTNSHAEICVVQYIFAIIPDWLLKCIKLPIQWVSLHLFHGIVLNIVEISLSFA